PEEPALGPRRVAPEWIGGRPGVGQRVPPGPPAVVGPAAGGPPRAIIVRGAPWGGHDRQRVVVRRDLADGAAGHGGGRVLALGHVARGAAARKGGIDAGQRLGVPTLATERPRETGEIARRGVAPPVGIGVVAIDMD